MHSPNTVRRRDAVMRFVIVAPMLLLTACEAVSARSTPPARLLPESSISVAGVTVGANAASAGTATYAIRRDTLRESLALSGKVVPARSAQLRFRGAGNVTAVHVSSGQAVRVGDTLAELALDDESLRSARAQATLAELAHQTEQAKLDELQSGIGKDSERQLQVTIQRDLAEIERLQNEKAAAEATNARMEQARDAAQVAAERRVQRAEAALETAKESLAAAQADVKQAQEEGRADLEQASLEAAGAAASASAAVRAAARALQQAEIRLRQAKMEWAGTRAGQQLDMHGLRLDQQREALADARRALAAAEELAPSGDRTAHQIAAEQNAARSAVRSLERAIEVDTLELKHLQANSEAAKTIDGAEVRFAEFAVEAAKENLANLQVAEQTARQKADLFAKQASSDTPRANPQSMAAARAAVRQAEAALRAATVNLEDALDGQGNAGTANEPLPARFVERSIAAARAQLEADQARLAALQGGNEATQIAQQQTRVELLREQALTAAAAAQPVVLLKAPFDGTVAEVGIAPGQDLAPGGQAIDAESSEGRPSAIRLVSSDATAVVAEASESAVVQLSRGQLMDLTFPGLPGQLVRGTVVDVGSTAIVKVDQITYPVRIELGAPPPALKFGMTAQASMAVSEARDILVAPRRSVRTVGEQTVMDKIGADGQVHEVPVTIGRTFGTQVEVVGGVQEGDVVAVYEGVAATLKQP